VTLFAFLFGIIHAVPVYVSQTHVAVAHLHVTIILPAIKVVAAQHLVAITHVVALCNHVSAAIGNLVKVVQEDLITVLHMVGNLNGDGMAHAFIPLDHDVVLHTVSLCVPKKHQ
jgi:hypothetical protein